VVQGGDDSNSEGPSWALALGLALCALACVLAFATAGATTAAGERLGNVLGALLAPLLMAIIGRFLWVRLGPGHPPVMNWAWLLLLTGVIGVVLAASNAARTAQEEARSGGEEVLTKRHVGYDRDISRARAGASRDSRRPPRT